MECKFQHSGLFPWLLGMQIMCTQVLAYPHIWGVCVSVWEKVCVCVCVCLVSVVRSNLCIFPQKHTSVWGSAILTMKLFGNKCYLHWCVFSLNIQFLIPALKKRPFSTFQAQTLAAGKPQLYTRDPNRQASFRYGKI